MGVYFRTVFYKDVRQKGEGYIILADMTPILEEADKERGYVIKEELMKYYSSKILYNDIGEHSRIEEQISSSYGPGYEIVVSLPIR
jgi:hypothetical protein